MSRWTKGASAGADCSLCHGAESKSAIRCRGINEFPYRHRIAHFPFRSCCGRRPAAPSRGPPDGWPARRRWRGTDPPWRRAGFGRGRLRCGWSEGKAAHISRPVVITPRVRGNLRRRGLSASGNSDNPACAGEPVRLSPRSGLSPLVRGNCHVGHCPDNAPDAIPAGAGELRWSPNVGPRRCGDILEFAGKIRSPHGVARWPG